MIFVPPGLFSRHSWKWTRLKEANNITSNDMAWNLEIECELLRSRTYLFTSFTDFNYHKHFIIYKFTVVPEKTFKINE